MPKLQLKQMKIRHLQQVFDESEQEADIAVVIHGVEIPVTNYEGGTRTEEHPYGTLRLIIGQE